MRKKIHFIHSGDDRIYIEVGYPQRLPAPAVIVAHGLRSYYTGFLNMFAKALRQAGYISIKFHFVGTGKSSGKFEHKTTGAMLRNYRDVLGFVKTLPEVTRLGVVARSNAASLATLYGPDPDIKAYAFLAPPAYYSLSMGKFVKNAVTKGGYFYHHSFKRPHTKGPGRLPLNYVNEMRKFDRLLLQNMKHIKPVIFFQSTKDEAVRIDEGHFEYWKVTLPRPKKIILIQGGNHSYKGYKRFVIHETLGWFKRYLPVK